MQIRKKFKYSDDNDGQVIVGEKVCRYERNSNIQMTMTVRLI